jgi:hypothetical protein
MSINEFLSFFLSHSFEWQEFALEISWKFSNDFLDEIKNVISGLLGSNSVERNALEISGTSDSG